jgi:glycosyltransferase involved in cell wall biosynthesis
VASIARDADGFADALADLLTDDALWARRRAAQSAFAARRFSRAALSASLLAALADEAPAPAQYPAKAA